MTVSPTPPPVVVRVTPVAPGALPPTWTPTFTPSPLPPSSTPTTTLTATPAPTESAEAICEGFRLIYEFDNRKPFTWEGAIPLMFEIQSSEVVVRFLAVHRRSGENKGVELPGGQTLIANFPVNLLPAPGLYDWRLSVISETYGELCQQNGTFVVLRPRPQSPEATPEPTDTSSPAD